MKCSSCYHGFQKLGFPFTVRIMVLAGHCYRHAKLPASKLALWEPTQSQGVSEGGRTTVSLVDVLKQDLGVAKASELHEAAKQRA